jgi:nicotinate phosphoribosyltransferase
LEALQTFRYEAPQLEYLGQLGFDEEFLEYLSGFSFRGTIWSVPEGEVVFPLEPILRAEGGLIETQIIETLLLNVLNFQTLIATKAARYRQAAGTRALSEFGLRGLRDRLLDQTRKEDAS